MREIPHYIINRIGRKPPSRNWKIESSQNWKPQKHLSSSISLHAFSRLDHTEKTRLQKSEEITESSISHLERDKKRAKIGRSKRERMGPGSSGQEKRQRRGRDPRMNTNVPEASRIRISEILEKFRNSEDEGEWKGLN